MCVRGECFDVALVISLIRESGVNGWIGVVWSLLDPVVVKGHMFTLMQITVMEEFPEATSSATRLHRTSGGGTKGGGA